MVNKSINNQEKLTIIYSKPFKRFLSFVTDQVIFLVLCLLVFSLGSYNIFINMPSYITSYDKETNAVTNMRNMYTDSKLSIFDEDSETYSHELAINKNLNDKLQENDYDDQGIENDIFYHFYVNYASSSLHKEETQYSFTKTYVNENIYKVYDQGETVLYELNSGNIELPLHFTLEAKQQLNRYLNDEIDETSERFYLAYQNKSNEMMAEAADILLTSDEYANEHYTYAKNIDYVLFHFSMASIITYTLVFGLYYVLVPLLLKNGKTLGKYFMGLGVYDENRDYAKKRQIVLRAVLQYLTFFYMFMFIPFLQIGVQAINMPFILFSSYSLTAIIPAFISLLLALTSFITLCVTNTTQSLHDKAAHTIVGKLEEKVIDPLDNNTSEATDNGK